MVGQKNFFGKYFNLPTSLKQIVQKAKSKNKLARGVGAIRTPSYLVVKGQESIGVADVPEGGVKGGGDELTH